MELCNSGFLDFQINVFAINMRKKSNLGLKTTKTTTLNLKPIWFHQIVIYGLSMPEKLCGKLIQGVDWSVFMPLFGWLSFTGELQSQWSMT